MTTMPPSRAGDSDESSKFPQVDKRSGLSITDFNREYRGRKRPVILTDAIDGWKARTEWTLEFFKTRYASSSVLVYAYHGEKYKPKDATRMSLADFVNGVSAGDWNSFPYYIRDNWELLRDHPELSKYYTYPKYFFDWYSLFPSFMRMVYPRIFIGPKGAVTPLHLDIWGTHAWLSQLVGRKRWLLFPPGQKHLLYDCQVDPERPDYKRFPLYRDARPLECTIGPGDTIFVPGGWAHWVTSLDPTISLSANYMGPGAFRSPFTNAVKELALKRAWDSSFGRLGTRARTTA